MALGVNIDALIPREDFDVMRTAEDEALTSQTIQVRDLERGAFFYGALRKPDFQRETSEWDHRRVIGLVTTFIDGDLIPGVILWKNRDLLFVIDGSPLASDTFHNKVSWLSVMQVSCDGAVSVSS